MLKKIYATLVATAFLAGMTTLAMADSTMDKAKGVASSDKPAIESMEKSQPLEAQTAEAEKAAESMDKSQPLEAQATDAEKAAESIKAEPLKEQAKSETAEAYSEGEKEVSDEAAAKIDETVGKLEQKETKE